MVWKRYFIIFSGIILFTLIPVILLAQTGKIRGVIRDMNNSPLPGANVQIKGTTIGAASSLDGEYIILNVPSGTHTLVVSFMGFKTTTISNILVSPGLTTFQDVKLEESVIEGDQLVIVAQRPLIDKGETNEIHRVTSEDLETMPVRGVDNVVATMAGVIREGDELHVRGGRSDEMSFYVDNTNVTRPLTGDSDTGILSVIQNAIEMVQTQTGGFNAEYGGRMSGVTLTTMKTGGSGYKITGEMISDDFLAFKNAAGSKEVLGINKLYSFGYNDYVLTFSGPVIPSKKNLTFYAAGQAYNRMSRPTWFQGFHQDLIKVPQTWQTNEGQFVTDTLNLAIDTPPGRLPGGGTVGKIFQANLVWNVQPFRIKLGGNWSNSTQTSQTADPVAMVTSPLRGLLEKRKSMSYYANFTHTLNASAFYTLNAGYYERDYESMDPIWKHDFMKYGDPTYNPALLDTSWTRSFDMPFDADIAIVYPGTPWAYYTKTKESRYNVKMDFTKQFGMTHEVKFGGEFSRETLRRYSFNARNLLLQTASAEGKDWTDWDIYEGCNPEMQGYDWRGREVNQDMTVTSTKGGKEKTFTLKNKPQIPITLSGYIQDQIELNDLIINAGVRVDHFRNGVFSIDDLTALTLNESGYITDKHFGPERKYTYFSPRLGFSFPVTDRSVFHAQYGKYIQAPDPWEVMIRMGYNAWVSQIFRSTWWEPVANPNLKPENTTSYEFGFQMQFGQNASLDLTAFYRDTRDLLTIRNFVSTTGYGTVSYLVNGDFGTIKGLTSTFNLRRTSRIRAQISYTYSFAEGTGSAAGDHQDIAWAEESPFFPTIIYPLDYDIRHKGTVVLDARSQPNDGLELSGMHPLGNMGLNLKFDFHSGSPFTRIPISSTYSDVRGYNQPTPLGAPYSSTLPWFFQVDGRLDKTFDLGSIKLNAYIWVNNIFGTKGIVNGFRQTGRNDTDGWLQTEAGKDYAKRQGETAVKWYNARLTNSNSWGYQSPREIRFGLRFELF